MIEPALTYRSRIYKKKDNGQGHHCYPGYQLLYHAVKASFLLCVCFVNFFIHSIRAFQIFLLQTYLDFALQTTKI